MVKKIIKKMSDKMFNKSLDNLEKLELENNQKYYAKDIPVFIWFLKIIIVINMIYLLLLVIFPVSLLITLISIVMFIFNGFFIYGILKRKRWSWNLGVTFYLISILGNLFTMNPINLISGLIILIIFVMHKDYLNK